MLLVTYQSETDPVVAALRHSSHPREIVFLSAKQIVDDVEIFDTIDDGVPSIQWTLPSGQKITNSNDVLLINRLHYLDESLFADFHPEDRDYARQEFWAYLSFAFSAFPRLLGQPNFLGLSGPTAPLPMQWQEIINHSQYPVDLQTPNFYMGQAQHYEPLADAKEIVIGEPYDFFRWKANGEAELPKIAHDQFMFAFHKPRGEPVTIFVCGDEVLIRSPKNPEAFINQDKFLKIVEQLQGIFKLALGEYLLFEEGSSTTFGACYTCVSESTRQDPRFEEVFLRGLSHL